MRLSRLLLLPVATLAVVACSDDDSVTINSRPPLGGVRFINAVPDMKPVTIRMVDQLLWSANSVNGGSYGLRFRAATVHQATEAKARHIRVFPADSNIAEASRILLDTTITIEANKNVTLLLVPGQRTGATDSVAFVTINDDVTPAEGEVALRLVNASAPGLTPASVDGWLTADAETAPTGAPTWDNLASLTAGAYVTRAPEAVAVQTAADGAPATLWGADAPEGEPEADGIGALAGATVGGSALSAYVFPKACPTVTGAITVANCPAAAGSSGSIRTAYANPGVVFFVDKIPAPPTGTGGN
ncbi:MAG TPA: DUF4397 domain-containing protein [Gemmatimonadaceae bacterium]|nr:DUF4397 domain-containing protein [Gemmatimonadaceae bacterium]